MNRLMMAMFVLIVAGGAAVVNFTFTVTNASITSSQTSVSVSGPATLTVTGVGTDTGTFSASGSLANVSGGNVTVPFSVTLGHGSFSGTMTFPLDALGGSSSVSGSATITKGTGLYTILENTTVSGSGFTGSVLSGGDLNFSVSGTRDNRSFTFTVTDAPIVIAGTSTFSGPASLTLAGGSPDTGTFTASGELTALSGNLAIPFMVTLGHGTITGNMTFPETALLNSGSVSGSATITGGTGSYAGYTSSTLTASGTVTGSLLSSGELSFSISGAVSTGGSGTTAPNWTQLHPPLYPPLRSDGGLAYDSSHGQIVLFGGISQPGGVNTPVYNDTWLWDGTKWTQQSPQTNPPADFYFCMAYDVARAETVMFSTQGLTWVWDGTNWTQKSPQTSPSPRTFSAMTYDSAHSQIVLFGGRFHQDLNDTWVWDGVNWTQMSPNTSPPAREQPAMTYDSAHGEVVLFGGDNVYTQPSATYNDTWVWDGTNWTQESPSTSPIARSGAGMAYDSAFNKSVLFGGFNPPSTLLADTWVWDGSTWTQQSPQNSPQALSDFGIAYDSLHGQTILFGGTQSNGFNTNTVWAWTFGPLVPAINAVVNGASFAKGGVVPGEIATLFGTNVTTSTGINLTSGLPLPTAFLTDSLTANTKAVPLFAVDNVNGQQQINFQVPWEVASGPSATFVVENNGTPSASISVPVVAAQPGIFNYSSGGDTFGAILHANYQLANTANPAKPGETVLIYCTGLGAVSSPPADGEPGKGQPTSATPTVTMGGIEAIVSFSGLAPGFVGLYQVNAEVPPTLKGGNQPVVVELNGASSNPVLLPIE